MTEYDRVKKILSENIRGLMRLYSIDTYRDLSQLLDVSISPSGIANYANGRLGRLETLASIAEAFCVSTADLLTDGFAQSFLSQAVESVKRPSVESISAPPAPVEVVDTVVVPNVYSSEPQSVVEKDVPAFNFQPSPAARSTLLYLLDGVGISVSEIRDALEIRDGQTVYNFIGSSGPVTNKNRYIAVYLSLVLKLPLTEIGRLRGQKGPPQED